MVKHKHYTSVFFFISVFGSAAADDEAG